MRIFNAKKFFKEVGNDVELGTQIIKTFYSDAPSIFASLLKEIEGKYFQEALCSILSIKIAARNITAERIEDTASKIEHVIREKDADKALFMMLDLYQEIEIFGRNIQGKNPRT